MLARIERQLSSGSAHGGADPRRHGRRARPTTRRCSSSRRAERRGRRARDARGGVARGRRGRSARCRRRHGRRCGRRPGLRSGVRQAGAASARTAPAAGAAGAASAALALGQVGEQRALAASRRPSPRRRRPGPSAVSRTMHAAAVVGVGVALHEPARGQPVDAVGHRAAGHQGLASSRPGESSYGAPARRSAASTSNSQASMPCAVNASRRARSRWRASRETRLKTCDRGEVEVGALARPRLDQLSTSSPHARGRGHARQSLPASSILTSRLTIRRRRARR